MLQGVISGLSRFDPRVRDILIKGGSVEQYRVCK